MYVIRKIEQPHQYFMQFGPSTVCKDDVFFHDRDNAKLFADFDIALEASAALFNKHGIITQICNYYLTDHG